MIGIEISILVKAHKRQEFLRTMESLVQCRRGAAGCKSIEFFEEHGRPNHFLWVERWPAEAHARRRLETEDFRALLGAIKTLGELQGLDIVGVGARETRAGEPESGQ